MPLRLQPPPLTDPKGSAAANSPATTSTGRRLSHPGGHTVKARPAVRVSSTHARQDPKHKALHHHHHHPHPQPQQRRRRAKFVFGGDHEDEESEIVDGQEEEGVKDPHTRHRHHHHQQRQQLSATEVIHFRHPKADAESEAAIVDGQGSRGDHGSHPSDQNLTHDPQEEKRSLVHEGSHPYSPIRHGHDPYPLPPTHSHPHSHTSSYGTKIENQEMSECPSSESISNSSDRSHQNVAVISESSDNNNVREEQSAGGNGLDHHANEQRVHDDDHLRPTTDREEEEEQVASFDSFGLVKPMQDMQLSKAKTDERAQTPAQQEQLLPSQSPPPPTTSASDTTTTTETSPHPQTHVAYLERDRQREILEQHQQLRVQLQLQQQQIQLQQKLQQQHPHQPLQSLAAAEHQSPVISTVSIALSEPSPPSEHHPAIKPLGQSDESGNTSGTVGARVTSAANSTMATTTIILNHPPPASTLVVTTPPLEEPATLGKVEPIQLAPPRRLAQLLNPSPTAGSLPTLSRINSSPIVSIVSPQAASISLSSPPNRISHQSEEDKTTASGLMAATVSPAVEFVSRFLKPFTRSQSQVSLRAAAAQQLEQQQQQQRSNPGSFSRHQTRHASGPSSPTAGTALSAYSTSMGRTRSAHAGMPGGFTYTITSPPRTVTNDHHFISRFLPATSSGKDTSPGILRGGHHHQKSNSSSSQGSTGSANMMITNNRVSTLSNRRRIPASLRMTTAASSLPADGPMTPITPVTPVSPAGSDMSVQSTDGCYLGRNMEGSDAEDPYHEFRSSDGIRHTNSNGGNGCNITASSWTGDPWTPTESQSRTQQKLLLQREISQDDLDESSRAIREKVRTVTDRVQREYRSVRMTSDPVAESWKRCLVTKRIMEDMAARAENAWRMANLNSRMRGGGGGGGTSSDPEPNTSPMSSTDRISTHSMA